MIFGDYMGRASLSFAIEKARGRNPFIKDVNPVSPVFFQSIIGIGLMFPLVIGAAQAAEDPNLMVLGVAILAGIIWIQYGWAANDPVGLRHAIGRAVGLLPGVLVRSRTAEGDRDLRGGRAVLHLFADRDAQTRRPYLSA